MPPSPRVCFSHIAGQHLSHFIHNGDAYHTAARCAGSTDIATVPFVHRPGFIFSFVVSITSASVVCYWFYISWPISSGFISFSCLTCAVHSFLCSSAPLSLAPACWRARNPVCSTACQFDKIHAAISCHLRTKRDRSLLSDLSHISGGRILTYKGVSYCQASGVKDLNWLTQHLQRYILPLPSVLWTTHM